MTSVTYQLSLAPENESMKTRLISKENTLAENFDLAYADKRITQREIAEMQKALDERVNRFGNDYPGVAAFERQYEVNLLIASASAEWKRSIEMLHPRGKPSLQCMGYGTPGNPAKCVEAQELYTRGFYKMAVAGKLSTGFTLGEIELAD